MEPKSRFASLCNPATVDLEPIGPAEPAEEDDPDRPHQRSANVEDAGMGDLLRFDAARLRVLLERHHLFTGSERARALLEDWDNALACFVKIMPKDYKRALSPRAEERAGNCAHGRCRMI